MIGRNLSHYKILEKLGSGGMGDVYLAEDTELSRKVALKVLPPELAGSVERRARFKREAKTIAALNHPNIVTVHSVEEVDGVHFITMELVQGNTVTEVLTKSGMPLDQFFDIAVPLADAVAAAHQKGITHRDLKPDNVMVGDDGRVKVLDFGLAKETVGFIGERADSELPTRVKTGQGTIVGTLHYMSPEQATGQTVGSRSDIFSLGILFYEMLTGVRPFKGDSPGEVLSSIVKDSAPAVGDVNDHVPRELSKIVQRCLAKDPSRRFQNALDIRNELEEVKADLSSGELRAAEPTRSSPVHKGRAALTLTLVLLAIAGAIYFTLTPRTDGFRLVNPAQVTSTEGVENYPTWSPDGSRLAYEFNSTYLVEGNWDIWVSQMGGEPVNLTADNAGDDRLPAWSPDGRWIAFCSHRDDAWGLYTMSSLGGGLRKLLPVSSQDILGRNWSPQWSPDGTEVAVALPDASGNFIEIVTLESLEKRRVELREHQGTMVHDLRWSPDGRTFAYVEGLPSGGTTVTRLWVVPASGGTPEPVTDGRSLEWSPTWAPDSLDLFFVSNRGGSMDLWRQRMGSQGGALGEAEPITAGVGMRSASLSPDRTKLAYSVGRPIGNVWRVPILKDGPATWADAEQITFDQAFAEFVDVSPDAHSLAVSSDRGGNQDLWILPGNGGEVTQLTRDPAADMCPRWSPDGKEIAFHSTRSGNRDIWVMPSEGGPARQLTSHPAQDLNPAWSPNGKEIAFASFRGGNSDIWVVAIEGGEPRQVTHHLAGAGNPVWSPDGGWLVYSFGGSEGQALWRVPAAGGEPEQLADAPAWMPRFAPDGKKLYYTGANERTGQIWSLSLDDGRDVPVTDLAGRPGRMGWVLHTDGQYLYFPWQEDLGDIWVMDVVTDERE